MNHGEYDTFADHLRQKTNEAIRRGEEKRQKELKLQRDQEERERREWQLKAEGVVSQIPSRCEKEAEAGRSHAVVYSIPFEEYYQHGHRGAVTAECLTGAAPIVWRHCVAAKLSPTLESWHDGVGIKGGWNIVVHW
jgi:hypothetical protein